MPGMRVTGHLVLGLLAIDSILDLARSPVALNHCEQLATQYNHVHIPSGE